MYFVPHVKGGFFFYFFLMRAVVLDCAALQIVAFKVLSLSQNCWAELLRPLCVFGSIFYYMTDRLHLVPQHLARSVAKMTICLLYHLALQWNLTHHCFKCVNTVNFNILEHHCVSFSNNKFVLLLKGSINVSFSHVLCVQCLHLHHVALNATIYRPEGVICFFFSYLYIILEHSAASGSTHVGLSLCHSLYF